MAGTSADDGTAVSLPWIEPGYREFKDIFASAVVLVLLVVSVVGFINAWRGLPGSQLAGAIVALLMTIVTATIWYGPTGGVGARITVDSDGLWVRHWGWNLGSRRIEFSIPKHLPAEQLGVAKLVTEERRSRMWRRSMSLIYDGKPLGWTRNNVVRDTTEAVLIEQTGTDLDRPWWLLRCQSCPELIEALELCRQQRTQSTA